MLILEKKDMNKDVDFVFISGDAFVDHQSFGTAVIARILVSHGYSVAIIDQSNINNDSVFQEFGTPKLGFLISSGNIESMVNHYTVNKKRRTNDVYSPNGLSKRPDRAVIVYSKIVKRLFKDSPIIIGGIEASLRRFSHYDYWSNQMMQSILVDSKADLLVYGNGEKAMIEIADYLASGLHINDLTFILGTSYKSKNIDNVYDYILLPEYNLSKKDYALSFKIQHENNDFLNAKNLVEPYKNFYIVQNKPQDVLSKEEFDDLYDLPFSRLVHPKYENMHIAAYDEIKFSINVNRGCNGSCHFCAITYHQGRHVQMRSLESSLKEAKRFLEEKDFKGYIHDVGGPTANFHDEMCDKQTKFGSCQHKLCIGDKLCPSLKVSHTAYLKILRSLRNLDGIKKVFVRSGIRYDYVIKDKNNEFITELAKYHVSGQLRVAPEHISDEVLKNMNKPKKEVYFKFLKRFDRVNNKDQYVIPYLISSHPGSSLKEALELALYLKEININYEQVQDFYPTPGTMSTVMYYTGFNPLTNEEVYIPDENEKKIQRAFLQYNNPKNYDLVYEGLKKLKRLDLVGSKKECLIKNLKNV